MSFRELDNLLTEERSTDGEPVVAKPEIVVIDDNESILRALSMIMGEAYHVVAVDNAEDGARAVRDETSAVVLDVKMPKHDGFWCFREIRKHNDFVPIIFNSAYQDIEDPYSIMNEYRPFGFIRKDGDMKMLLKTVDFAVKYYERIRQNNATKKRLEETRTELEKLRALVKSRD